MEFNQINLNKKISKYINFKVIFNDKFKLMKQIFKKNYYHKNKLIFNITNNNKNEYFLVFFYFILFFLY